MSDYISRAEAIREALTIVPPNLEKLVLYALSAIPAAKVREKKCAEWVRFPALTECSNCKNWIGVNEHPPFCSRCGAEMELRK